MFFFLNLDLSYSLFYILAIKTNYRVDRVLFNFPSNLLEILSLVIIGFGCKDMK